MTTLRYFYVQKPDYFQSNRFVAKVGLSAQIMTLLLAISNNAVIEFSIGSSSLKNAVCRGVSFQFCQILQEHQQVSRLEVIIGRTCKWLILISRLSMLFTQLTFYIRLSKFMKQQNEKMEKSMSKKSFARRCKKNAISLRGQITVFIVDVFFNVATMLISVTVNFYSYSPIWVITVAILQQFISNAALIISSPELRREYFGDEDICIPKLLKLKRT